MAKRVIDDATLTRLADSIREVTGKSRTYTPDEMAEEVIHILDSLTYILVDENGTEVPAVFMENEVVFDATANDIRLGKVAVTGDGVTEGTKEIPAYHTDEGYRIVMPGASLDIPMYSDRCQYTKLQVVVCEFNSTMSDSTSAEMVVLLDNLYAVRSNVALANVTVDTSTQTIKLGITNDSDKMLILRYMTIKEEA